MTEPNIYEQFQEAFQTQNEEIKTLNEKVEKLQSVNAHLLEIIQGSGILLPVFDPKSLLDERRQALARESEKLRSDRARAMRRIDTELSRMSHLRQHVANQRMTTSEYPLQLPSGSYTGRDRHQWPVAGPDHLQHLPSSHVGNGHDGSTLVTSSGMLLFNSLTGKHTPGRDLADIIDMLELEEMEKMQKQEGMMSAGMVREDTLDSHQFGAYKTSPVRPRAPSPPNSCIQDDAKSVNPPSAPPSTMSVSPSASPRISTSNAPAPPSAKSVSPSASPRLSASNAPDPHQPHQSNQTPRHSTSSSSHRSQHNSHASSPTPSQHSTAHHTTGPALSTIVSTSISTDVDELANTVVAKDKEDLFNQLSELKEDKLDSGETGESQDIDTLDSHQDSQKNRQSTSHSESDLESKGEEGRDWSHSGGDTSHTYRTDSTDLPLHLIGQSEGGTMSVSGITLREEEDVFALDNTMPPVNSRMFSSVYTKDDYKEWRDSEVRRPSLNHHFISPSTSSESLERCGLTRQRWSSMRSHKHAPREQTNNNCVMNMPTLNHNGRGYTISDFDDLRIARRYELKRINDRIQKPIKYSAEMHAAVTKLNSLVRGYLIRRLLHSDKVQIIVRTIKDTAEFALSIRREASRPSSAYDATLHARIVAQLRSSLYEVHEIFFEWSVAQQMALVGYTRTAERNREREAKLQAEMEARMAYRQSSRSTIPAAMTTSCMPRVSTATLKRRTMKEQKEKSCSEIENESKESKDVITPRDRILRTLHSNASNKAQLSRVDNSRPKSARSNISAPTSRSKAMTTSVTTGGTAASRDSSSSSSSRPLTAPLLRTRTLEHPLTAPPKTSGPTSVKDTTRNGTTTSGLIRGGSLRYPSSSKTSGPEPMIKRPQPPSLSALQNQQPNNRSSMRKKRIVANLGPSQTSKTDCTAGVDGDDEMSSIAQPPPVILDSTPSNPLDDQHPPSPRLSPGDMPTPAIPSASDPIFSSSIEGKGRRINASTVTLSSGGTSSTMSTSGSGGPASQTVSIREERRTSTGIITRHRAGSTKR